MVADNPKYPIPPNPYRKRAEQVGTINTEPTETARVVASLRDVNDDIRQMLLHLQTCFSAIIKLPLEPGIIDGLATLGANQCGDWCDELDTVLDDLVIQVRAMEADE